MTAAKRALIVDDSRSARVILSRMLEAYDLEVDAAESAEQALEYLRQARPDVIFMDHLMPGMDGFQAIQAIKSNPDTAVIPVMMYTSQEGELYVSQARALGAVGVLPKTVKQGDVSRVLYQLHLLPERREPRSPLFSPGTDVVEIPQPTPPAPARPAQIDASPGSASELEKAVRNAVAPALAEQNAELRRYIGASVEVLTRKLNGEKEAVPLSPPATVVTAPPPTPAGRWSMLAAIAAALALVPIAILAVLYTRTLASTQSLLLANANLSGVVQQQQTQLAGLQQALHAATTSQTAAANSAAAKMIRDPVPYGEVPLSGARQEQLRALLDELRDSGFHGKVKITSYAGEFCLTGNGIEGYSLAADDLPFKRCDLVGNPFDDNLTAAQRQSLGFANLLAGVRQQPDAALTIEVANAGRQPAVAYPEAGPASKASAGEWNRIAAQNNRVEFVAEAATE